MSQNWDPFQILNLSQTTPIAGWGQNLQLYKKHLGYPNKMCQNAFVNF